MAPLNLDINGSGRMEVSSDSSERLSSHTSKSYENVTGSETRRIRRGSWRDTDDVDRTKKRKTDQSAAKEATARNALLWWGQLDESGGGVVGAKGVELPDSTNASTQPTASTSTLPSVAVSQSAESQPASTGDVEMASVANSDGALYFIQQSLCSSG